MRKDMKDVIIDRPRIHGDGGKSIPPKGTKKRFNKTPWEDQKNFESTSRRRVYGYNCKQLNEHLSPLRRWLSKQVGRNWDDVWSEICENLSVRNATTAHVRDHADQYVEKNCIIDEEGRICDSVGLPLHGSRYWKGWYVDPVDNTLREAPSYERYVREVKKKWVEGKDDKHCYYLIKGIWYEVGFEPYPAYRRADPLVPYRYQNNPNRVHDMVIAATWENGDYRGSSEDDCNRRHGEKIYAATKRQLSKKEIRKFNLWDSELGKNYLEGN